MTPDTSWATLRVSVLALLLLTSDAESEVSKCETGTKVRHGTAYKASQGEKLQINCTVRTCKDSPMPVNWFKSKTKVNVNKTTAITQRWDCCKNSEGTSYLVFESILPSDSGSYHCEYGDEVSHLINVSVSNGTVIAETTPKDIWWQYVYAAVGVVLIVAGVITISVLSNMAIPMSNQPSTQPRTPPYQRGVPHSHCDQLSKDPECIYQKPQKRADREGNATLDRPVHQARVSRENEFVYGKVKRRQREDETEEEEDESPVLYAALNHQMLLAASKTPQRPKENTSEYAAIVLS
ncbi:uncharacterized protein LOC130131820 [Lampris incognitus]|uniref:uncharacterized protein LOC130131820 n=1 Tax=Lampris incognitus TaxID=2546036 RepID=UPI0024B60E4E|nr:uncharacterized protein LOC130131820 [Lampris incognitus]